MDPISGFASIVSLAAEFLMQRQSGKEASLEEFKDWLADHRQAEVVKILESNASTAVSIKAMLHVSHREVLDILEQIRQQISASQESVGTVPAPIVSDAIEKIVLGVENKFLGTDEAIDSLAMRCAVHAIQGKTVEFQIELAETAFNPPPEDPLALARYEKARTDRAQRLKRRLEMLTSKEVHEWWRYFLIRKEDWAVVIQNLILRADLASNGVATGKKIDVWRTDKPVLNTSIDLSHNEMHEALQHLGFESANALRMGSHWRAATDLPLGLIVRHIIPSIIAHLEIREIPASGDVLDLAAWHIGEG
ncbi:hypothetical protein FB548_3646 [Pseudoxanthomonas sp. 3HH-4]|uniref:hypothetical protein n=1 Tax=Pseudoxanthomonas sp. 3HH-4 TaxID=1690214 RepID=UPI0011541530|nr:hypothetical protein [Pseudoxanthomonas sp. 3HH-4]TQM03686.1 hypothetical protein FB548_3646 [Pseudoxanthomonas sp. 3HH-4]